MIIQASDTIYVEVDLTTNATTVYDTAEMLARKKEIEDEINELSDTSGANLLKWAKKHFPTEKGIKDKTILENELMHLEKKLAEIADGN